MLRGAREVPGRLVAGRAHARLVTDRTARRARVQNLEADPASGLPAFGGFSGDTAGQVREIRVGQDHGATSVMLTVKVERNWKRGLVVSGSGKFTGPVDSIRVA